MDRAKVIIHMDISIDGKIDGVFMEAQENPISGDFYAEELYRLSNVNANGATTVAMYAATGNPDLSRYDATGIEYEDWRGDVQSETWDVSFDRKGRCGWEVNYFEYGGKKSRAIEVVTKQAKKEYLAFLRSMEIPYIIAGDTEMDIPLALRKLKKHFGIEKISLCGGSRINGAFLEAGCVDEISLVVEPFISGDLSVKSAFDTLGTFVNTKFVFRQANPLDDGGVQLLFAREA